MKKIMIVMALLAITLVACNPNPTTTATPTVEPTVEPTPEPTPTPTAIPTLPTPTRIAPPPFSCAAPTELPSGKLICWPVGFESRTNELESGAPTGASFDPGDLIQLDMDASDVDNNVCVLHGASIRYVDCRVLIDWSAFTPDEVDE